MCTHRIQLWWTVAIFPFPNNTQRLTKVCLLLRDEIVRAVQRLGAAAAEGKVDLTKKLSEAEFAKYLDTKDVPDPDLLIRTSSEKRLSNFLLWELAYAEFAFCDKLWPDFTGEDLQACVRQFMERQRRLGK